MAGEESRDEGKVRKLRAVRPDALDETAESILPGLPRVGALDALLREVDGLRLSLETDLTMAASAVEAGAVSMARDIIDSDIDGLRRFESRALDHLAGLSAADLAFDRDVDLDVHQHVSWWRRVPKTPFVAAASVVAFLLLAVPHTVRPANVNAANVSANERLEQIQLLASAGRTSQIRDAAVSLHGQLLVLVEQAKTDPQAAQRGLQLLSDERSIISLSGDSAALKDVLTDSAALSNLIISHLPAAVRPTVPPVQAVPVTAPTTAPTRQPSAKPTTSPSSKPSAKPSSTPSSKPSSKPSSTPSPSPSSGTPVLPTSPGIQ